MKIDIVIANPPYNRHSLHSRIMNQMKCKTIKCIALMPINVTVKYKNAIFIDKPFYNDIAWNNVFLVDMMGNINNHFSKINAPFFSNNTVQKSKEPFYRICIEGNKLVIKKFVTDNTKYRWNCIIKEECKPEIQKFLDWINIQDNKIINEIKRTFTPLHVSKYAINKLWELYNEQFRTSYRKWKRVD